ncbi:transcriptional regulator [Mizugakiibacter sediminis]|uniref:Transcriptional regulator n=1 Tax=Mizugakiibacter sediminis TaxID=1475481 RepID=A0A0K8QPB0_9GAMM|nr:LysR family transcriptional regulator [Mizugakiibacter sediminis]GAP66719.1 transcriptional regulator [Mizugakiibacter sediminis]
MEDLSAIVVFTRVVEAKSFAAAAPQLGMTASGVSRAIARLEAQLGVRLLSRTTRALRTTDEGAAFYERCRDILADLNEATEAIGGARRRPEGRLRVATSVAVGRACLMPHLPDFRTRYPDIRLELLMSDRPTDLIETGADCAIRVGDLADSSLIARRIGEMRVLTCAAPGYLQRHGVPASIDDLDGHSCIGYTKQPNGRPLAWMFDTPDGRVNVDVDARLTINDAEAVLQAGVMGLGLIQTGDYLANSYLQRGELRLVLPDVIAAGPPVWIVYPQRRHLSARVQVFIDWMTALFASCAGFVCPFERPRLAAAS